MFLNVIPTATIVFFWVLVGLLIVFCVGFIIYKIISPCETPKQEVIDWYPKKSENILNRQQCCEDFLKRENLKRYRKLYRDDFLKIISIYTYDSIGMKILLKRAKQMLENPTIGESILYKYFSDNKIKYFPQQIVCCQHSYIMDAYLPDYHLNIEVDGGYHRTKEQKIKDWARSKDIFDTFRIKTIRLTNKQLETGYFVTKLENALEENKIE